MTGGQSGSIPAAGFSGRWASAIGSLAVGGPFFALWFWLLPQWLGLHVEMAGAARRPWLAAVPRGPGLACGPRSVSDFGWLGRGTAAPINPPQPAVVAA